MVIWCNWVGVNCYRFGLQCYKCTKWVWLFLQTLHFLQGTCFGLKHIWIPMSFVLRLLETPPTLRELQSVVRGTVPRSSTPSLPPGTRYMYQLEVDTGKEGMWLLSHYCPQGSSWYVHGRRFTGFWGLLVRCSNNWELSFISGTYQNTKIRLSTNDDIVHTHRACSAISLKPRLPSQLFVAVMCNAELLSTDRHKGWLY